MTDNPKKRSASDTFSNTATAGNSPTSAIRVSSAEESDKVTPANINATLFKTGEFSDMTVKCDGWEFKGHKSILCPQSSFFRAACEGGFKESYTAVIAFPKERPVTLWLALRYLYTGHYSAPDVSGGEINTHPVMGEGEFFPACHLMVYAMAEKYRLGSLKDYAMAKFKRDVASRSMEELLRTFDYIRETVVERPIEPEMSRMVIELINAIFKNSDVGKDVISVKGNSKFRKCWEGDLRLTIMVLDVALQYVTKPLLTELTESSFNVDITHLPSRRPRRL